MPVIYSLNHFAGILGLDLSELKTIIHNIDGYYAYYLIKKKHGGKRRIVTPYRNLKMIQTWILHEILNKIPVHSQCKGFVKVVIRFKMLNHILANNIFAILI